MKISIFGVREGQSTLYTNTDIYSDGKLLGLLVARRILMPTKEEVHAIITSVSAKTVVTSGIIN